MPYCTNCGRPLASTSNFCMNCGSRQVAPGGVANKQALGREGIRPSAPPPPEAAASPSVDAGAHQPSDLLNYLDRSSSTDELYEMLRTRSATEITDVCKTFPIESIHLHWGSVGDDARTGDLRAIASELLSEDGKRDVKRFEVITALGVTQNRP